MNRQVFFVRMGSWDTHSDQLERLPGQLAQLETATSMFQGIVDDLGLADSVTAFTASDFGRTLTSNGNGTDHGWGGHQFEFGGLKSFYESVPAGAPPSWWYENGEEPILFRLDDLVARMLADTPRPSSAYLKLYKDGFLLDRHFERLASSPTDAELARIALHGEEFLCSAGTETSIDGSIRFSTSARCLEVAEWLASPAFYPERLLEAANGERNVDFDEVRWAVGRLGWVRSRLEKLHRDAAQASNVVLSVWD